jgi:hypothetical protein
MEIIEARMHPPSGFVHAPPERAEGYQNGTATQTCFASSGTLLPRRGSTMHQPPVADLQRRIHALELDIERMRRRDRARTRVTVALVTALALSLGCGLACGGNRGQDSLLLTDPGSGATVELSPAGLRFAGSEGTQHSALVIDPGGYTRLVLNDAQGRDRWVLGLLADQVPVLEAYDADGRKGLAIRDDAVQLHGREGRLATLAMLGGESATLRLDALDESISLTNPGAAASLLMSSGEQRVTLVADHLSISDEVNGGMRMGTLHPTRVSFLSETADGESRAISVP